MENTTSAPNGVSKNSITKEEYNEYMRTTEPCSLEAVSPRQMKETKEQNGCPITASDFVALRVEEPAKANSRKSLETPEDPFVLEYAAEINENGTTTVYDSKKGIQERAQTVNENESLRISREQIELRKAVAEKTRLNEQQNNDKQQDGNEI